MLLFLRRLKHAHFMNERFRRYLLYALGELLLVIVGILIALQIDNWNTERQQEATLTSYLQSIATNMRGDAEEIDSLRAQRSERILDSMRASFFMMDQTTFTAPEIFFFNKVTNEAHDNLYFKADTSGFEALKASGVLDRLQGRKIQRTLSRYYDAVGQIEVMETRLNEFKNTLWTQLVLSIPAELELYALANPITYSPERFQELQPIYGDIVNSSVTRELLGTQFEESQIIREYDRLRQIGEEFYRQLEAGTALLENERVTETSARLESSDGAGYPDIVVGGQISAYAYWIGNAAANNDRRGFNYRSVRRAGDSLVFTYGGGTVWASIFFGVFGVAEGRTSLDYSSFEKLSLEMKGSKGGELIDIVIKDRYQPDTEIPPMVRLELTDEWQTYDLDLDSFNSPDLSALHIPLGFNFGESPVSFAVRNAVYVDNDE